MIATVYRGFGIGLVGLAAIGAFLPLLPSTPFLLLATGCFMRSSPQWNERLFRSPLFGQALRDWHTDRSVSPKTKIMAIGMMSLVGVSTLASGSMPWLINMIFVITMTVAICIVFRLPSRSRKNCLIGYGPNTTRVDCHLAAGRAALAAKQLTVDGECVHL